MSNKLFYIHGHFYQPPREDVITGLIPNETGVAPYNNWNERIHAECYKPNAELKNFERISFNIGPTLFSWMEFYDPATYKAIIEQENVNFRQYGIGNAMAQPYNHTILPLASRRDKITQVRWGIADYLHRFKHVPTGMWLPETAVDNETLEILSEHGIQFTILAPWQADESAIDTTQPYRVNLDNGNSIIVFFYQMDLSTRISFDPSSTINADQFILEHLLTVYKDQDDRELIGAVSDGELYGHHQQFREKFLARLLAGPTLDDLANHIYPARYLLEYPVTHTCKLKQNTSWSCHHGIDRWQQQCDCAPGGTWKKPLRKALDVVSSIIDTIYENEMLQYTSNPWQLRDSYINVLLGEQDMAEMLKQNGIIIETSEQASWHKLLLDAQVARQKMYTSCGFFFDELNRIEPKNNIGYAAQATALVEKATGEELAWEIMTLFKDVSSNRMPLSGDMIFDEYYHRALRNLSSLIISRD